MRTSNAAIFGSRLAEERKRLGLKQPEFASLVGIAAPEQSLYETGSRELRAGYLAHLAEAGVDVIYVLTGNRRRLPEVGGDLTQLIDHYMAMPAPMQVTVVRFVTDLPGAVRQAKDSRRRGRSSQSVSRSIRRR